MDIKELVSELLDEAFGMSGVDVNSNIYKTFCDYLDYINNNDNSEYISKVSQHLWELPIEAKNKFMKCGIVIGEVSKDIYEKYLRENETND